jgi:CRP-like cAMP-binding protein
MSSQEMKKYRKSLYKGEVLLEEGETGSEFFLLEEGIFDVLVKGSKVNTIDASEAQDFVGEVGAILGTPRTASVVAASRGVALCLPKIELESLLKCSPSLGIRLIRSLCKKLVSSMSHLAEFQVKESSILDSGNTDVSLRNYMKGLLHFVELAGGDSEGGKSLLNYFLQTNPWGIRHGDKDLVLSRTSTDE